MSDDRFWRGVPRVHMIWHGSWSDPELYLTQGCFRCVANYYAVEDAMYADFKEWLLVENIDVKYDTEEEEELFNKHCVENKHLVYMFLKNAGKWERM